MVREAEMESRLRSSCEILCGAGNVEMLCLAMNNG